MWARLKGAHNVSDPRQSAAPRVGEQLKGPTKTNPLASLLLLPQFIAYRLPPPPRLPRNAAAFS
uniref:Uncharacterized protein n=1 Tax=Oryza punctata TaxID=4537 RepID=A0A0E0KTY6_ORYPU